MTVTLDYSADIQREIFGNHDGYVRKIEDDLHVAIIPRDGAVKVSGESRQVSSAVAVLDRLAGIVRGGFDIEEQNVDYSLEMKDERDAAALSSLDGEIICEATAVIDPEPARRSRGLVDEQTAYLEAFRTNEPFMGQGYFSRLFAFMLEDLRRRGYRRVTLGVETNDMKNKAIYTHYGFTGYLTTEQERYPDGTTVEVEYYAKTLFTDGISSEAGESPES